MRFILVTVSWVKMLILLKNAKNDIILLDQSRKQLRLWEVNWRPKMPLSASFQWSQDSGNNWCRKEVIAKEVGFQYLLKLLPVVEKGMRV
jgi:hypothetical protein